MVLLRTTHRPDIGGRLVGFRDHPLWLAAWREFQVARGQRGMVTGTHDQGAGNLPRWFVVCELGEGRCDCGRCSPEPDVSLTKSFQRWRHINREALGYLDDDSSAAREYRGADHVPPAEESVSNLIARVRARLGAET